MYQFFVEPSQIQGTRIVITGNDVNHIKNVLRMQPGEEIAVSNGEDGKEYRCGIEELYEDEIVCTLVETADCMDVIMFIDREEQLGNKDGDILEIRAECTERFVKLTTKLADLCAAEYKR